VHQSGKVHASVWGTRLFQQGLANKGNEDRGDDDGAVWPLVGLEEREDRARDCARSSVEGVHKGQRALAVGLAQRLRAAPPNKTCQPTEAKQPVIINKVTYAPSAQQLRLDNARARRTKGKQVQDRPVKRVSVLRRLSAVSPQSPSLSPAAIKRDGQKGYHVEEDEEDVEGAHLRLPSSVSHVVHSGVTGGGFLEARS
jgi:hypothetical protein